MKGTFICMGLYTPGGVLVKKTNSAAESRPGPPQVEDIAESYEPIQMAEFVVFVGVDGSAWMVKNRYGAKPVPHPIASAFIRKFRIHESDPLLQSLLDAGAENIEVVKD